MLVGLCVGRLPLRLCRRSRPLGLGRRPLGGGRRPLGLDGSRCGGGRLVEPVRLLWGGLVHPAGRGLGQLGDRRVGLGGGAGHRPSAARALGADASPLLLPGEGEGKGAGGTGHSVFETEGLVGRHHQGRWHEHLGHDPAGGGRRQAHDDTEAAGQAAGHHESERPGHSGLGQRRSGEDVVGLGQCLDGHADATVLDGDGVAAGGRRTSHLHPGVGRGPASGVLEKLREKVGGVGGDVAEHGGVVVHQQVHPADVLHLGHTGPDDVGHGERAFPAARRGGAGQREEAFCVAADPGGQLVKPEEVLQRVGVLLLGLQAVEKFDLVVDQALHAAGQVDEDFDGALLGNCLVEEGGLADGQPGSCALEVVEGSGNGADLAARGQAHRRECQCLVVPTGPAQGLHERLQMRGTLSRFAKALQRRGDGAGHRQGQTHCRHHSHRSQKGRHHGDAGWRFGSQEHHRHRQHDGRDGGYHEEPGSDCHSGKHVPPSTTGPFRVGSPVRNSSAFPEPIVSGNPG